ncbi:hypothetical protein GCM10020000_41210 [Streptomyces olivoverticillatus]
MRLGWGAGDPGKPFAHQGIGRDDIPGDVGEIGGIGDLLFQQGFHASGQIGPVAAGFGRAAAADGEKEREGLRLAQPERLGDPQQKAFGEVLAAARLQRPVPALAHPGHPGHVLLGELAPRAGKDSPQLGEGPGVDARAPAAEQAADGFAVHPVHRSLHFRHCKCRSILSNLLSTGHLAPDQGCFLPEAAPYTDRGPGRLLSPRWRG